MCHYCRLLIVSAALLPGLAYALEPLPMPPGLSPAAQTWFRSYQSVDKEFYSECQVAHCRHLAPPISDNNQNDLARGASLSPLSDLPSPDAAALARFFMNRRDLTDSDNRDDQAALSRLSYSGDGPRLPIPLPALLIFVVLPGYFIVQGIRHRLARQAASSSGYELPVDWRITLKNPIKLEIGASPTFAGRDYGAIDARSLVTPALLAERAAMPPFLLWYYQGDYTEVPNHESNKWLSVVDGNMTRGAPAPGMPTYLQRVESGGIMLYRVTPEAMQDITRGPYRKARIPAVRHAGGPVTLTLPAGNPGAPMPPPPRPMEDRTSGGSSKEGTGNSDAEPA